VKSLIDLLLGRPLKSSEEIREKTGPAAGIAIFGLDALGSAAYGPEAALTVLIPLGASATNYILPISASVIALLLIVYFSYRQTIEAYPMGGGSYTVARQNLEVFPGLLAATALMNDHVLTAAVEISTSSSRSCVSFLISRRKILNARSPCWCRSWSCNIRINISCIISARVG
jgi:hypothetical protein